MSIREASTIILVSSWKNGKYKAKDGLRCLVIRRSDSSSHFPNSFVFPGGNLDKADKSVKWLKIFPLNIFNFNESKRDLELTEKSNILPGNISSKITAIRELFEECGILLCSRLGEANKFNFVNHLEITGINTWRNVVRENAENFITLCSENNCYPNVECLCLWSNWCTPPRYARRYNAYFFAAVLENFVKGTPDYQETDDIEWETPKNYLEKDSAGEIFLPPPQYYELSQLKALNSIEDFTRIAKNKRLRDCPPLMPIHVSLIDGHIACLPGDELYEILLEKSKLQNEVIEMEETVESARGNTLHRFEVILRDNDIKKNIMTKNYDPLLRGDNGLPRFTNGAGTCKL